MRSEISIQQLGLHINYPSSYRNNKISLKINLIHYFPSLGKLDELDVGKHPYQEKEPLPEWPDNTNPHTGEIGGPRGPEPTRYGDWERKGRVTDF